jgi:hypothetical protein
LLVAFADAADKTAGEFDGERVENQFCGAAGERSERTGAAPARSDQARAAPAANAGRRARPIAADQDSARGELQTRPERIFSGRAFETACTLASKVSPSEQIILTILSMLAFSNCKSFSVT